MTTHNVQAVTSAEWREAATVEPVDPWDFKPPTFWQSPEWTNTRGPAVGRLCAAVGMTPDPEQQLILDALFAVADDGGPAPAYETAVIGARQALKTGVGKMAALGWLFVTREHVITWSAHEFSTAWQTFLDLVALIENSPLLRGLMPPPTRKDEVVGGIRRGHGDVAIATKWGNELRFRARTNSGGRGLTGDKIVLDEAFALKDEHMGSLLPTLTVVPDPQLVYLSSAGLRTSEVLRSIRDRGRFASADADPSLAYFEWCADERSCRVLNGRGEWVSNPECTHPRPSEPGWKPNHCALDDEDLWAQAYPLLGRTRPNGTGLTLRKLRKFRRSEPSTEWARERLGWWDDPGTATVFGKGNWDACAGEIPSDAPLEAIGVAIGYKLAETAIVAATGTKDAPKIRVIEYGPGTDWALDRLVALRQEHPDARIVVDAAGPSGLLVRDIQQRDRTTAGDQIRPELPRVVDLLNATADLFTAVVRRKLVHENDPELTAAAAGAVRRTVRDRWLWGRTTSDVDISPLEAATLALWGLTDDPHRSAYEAGGVLTV